MLLLFKVPGVKVLVQVKVNSFIDQLEIPLTIKIAVFSRPELNLQAWSDDRGNQLMVSYYCNEQNHGTGALKARV